MYDGSGPCVRGTPGSAHARSGAFSGNLACANAYALTGGCGIGRSGWAAVQAVVHEWNGSAWTVCLTSGWKYGATGQAGGKFPGPWRPEQVYD